MLKKKKYFLLMFQKIIHMWKASYFSNDSKQKKWNYLAVEKQVALLRGITSKHDSDFYCPNCLLYFRTKNKLELHKSVCRNKDFYSVIMSPEDTEILEYDHNQKCDKVPFVIYAECMQSVFECIREKINGYKNNPETSSTTKVREHIPSDVSISVTSPFRNVDCRAKDCMKSFCESLREHPMKIISKRKKQQKSHENAEICYICKEKFEKKY